MQGLDSVTAKALVALNKDFYQEIGPLWNSDPNYFWAGWENLIPYLGQIFQRNPEVKILDLGCGNSRFISFLTNLGYKNFSYTGLDFDYNYLEQSNKLATSLQLQNFEFLQADLTETNLQDYFPVDQFDIVLAFGVFHHIPGLKNRLQMMQDISKIVKPEGSFVWTAWNFVESKRLAKRILELDSQELMDIFQKYEIDPAKLEPHDYILNWVKRKVAYRYAHWISPQEAQVYQQAGNFQQEICYFHDDRDLRRNRYHVFKLDNSL